MFMFWSLLAYLLVCCPLDIRIGLRLCSLDEVMEAALIISGSMPLPESAVCDANAPIANHAMEDEMKLTAFCAT